MIKENKFSLGVISMVLVLVVGMLLFTFVLLSDIGTSVFANDSEKSTTTVTVSNAAPTLTVSLNGGSDITLTEESFTWATVTVTVTDTNSCTDIDSIEAAIYYTSFYTNGTATAAATVDTIYYHDSLQDSGNQCATTSSGNTCTGDADTSVDYDCGFKMWYIASSSDSTYDSGDAFVWAAVATTSDGTASDVSATNSGQTVDVAGLIAASTTGPIAYGTLAPAGNNDAANIQWTATSTGNVPLDVQFAAGHATLGMCTDWPDCAGDTIEEGQQKYKNAQFNWTGGGGVALTTSAVSHELSNDQPTSTTTDTTDIVYWNLEIPSSQPTGTYTGTTSATIIIDS